MFCFSRFCCFCSRSGVKLKLLREIKCNDLSFTAIATKLIPELECSGLDSLLACESCTKRLKEMYVFRKNCSRNIRLLMKYAEELGAFGGFQGNVSVRLVDIGKSRDGSSDAYGNDSTSRVDAKDDATDGTQEIVEMENVTIKSEPFYDDDDDPGSHRDASPFREDSSDERRETENFHVKSEPLRDDPLRDTIKNEQIDIDDAEHAASETTNPDLVFERFADWKGDKRSISQELVLGYFEELAKTARSDLWTSYAVLKSRLLEENVDISSYGKLRAFLEQRPGERTDNEPAKMPAKRKPAAGAKRKVIDLELKSRIVKEYESGRKVNAIARDFRLARSTVSTILKDRERIKDAMESSCGYKILITRRRKGLIPEMEKSLAVWFGERVRSGAAPSLATVQVEARGIFERLKERDAARTEETFSASHGWFQRFRRRFGLESCGDSSRRPRV